MGFITKVVLSLIAGDLFAWWCADRFARRLPHRAAWRWSLLIFFLLQLGGLTLLILGRIARQPIEALIGKVWLSFVYLWHCLVLPPLLVVWIAAGAIWIVAAGTRKVLGISANDRVARVSDAPYTRRDFLALTAVAAPALLSIGATAVALPQLAQFRIRRFTISLPTLPAELDGLTIAHLSDLHVGRFTEGRVLQAIVRAANALEPDLTLLTGDLINYALADLPVALDLVKRLEARHGVFMCEGNHDLIENGAAFRSRTRESGVRLLLNESELLRIRGADVQLLGLRWGALNYRGSRGAQHGDKPIARSTDALLQDRTGGAFPILLAHHPHAWDFAEDVPLTLAGHTHGGQLMLSEKTGFGPAMFRYWSGLYRRADTALVVSNGVGNWFPLRVRAPAEIIHITLVRGSDTPDTV